MSDTRRPPPEGPADRPPGQTSGWEYKTMSFGGMLPHHQIEDALNEAGAEGWEAFACDGAYVYLKRSL
jgi:hypothetical protein